MNFKNKVVVITGASSGIGEASAIKFARKNAKIVLVSRRKEKLLQLQKKLRPGPQKKKQKRSEFQFASAVEKMLFSTIWPPH